LAILIYYLSHIAWWYRISLWLDIIIDFLIVWGKKMSWNLFWGFVKTNINFVGRFSLNFLSCFMVSRLLKTLLWILYFIFFNIFIYCNLFWLKIFDMREGPNGVAVYKWLFSWWGFTPPNLFASEYIFIIWRFQEMI